MASLITTIGGGGAFETTQAIKRPVTVLSDGSFAMLVIDRNQTGVTGDGGDGSGVAKFKVYHSTDATTWTLKNTITPTTAIKVNYDDGMIAAFCSGVANDNLHIAFVASDGSIRYYRLTHSAGPTWSVGSQELVWASAGGDVDGFRRLDMDILNQASGTYTGDCVVVAAYFSDIVGAYYLSLATGVRRLSDNTWQTDVPKVWDAAKFAYPCFWDITIAGELNGADPTTRKGMVAGVYAIGLLNGASGTAADSDKIFHFEVNCDTGAISNFVDHKTINAGLGARNRHYWVFSTGDGDFSFIGAIGTTGMKMYHYKVEFAPDTTSNSFWTKIAEGLSASLGDFEDINSYGIRGMGRSAFWGQALENKTTGGGLLVRDPYGIRIFGVREIYVPGSPGTWSRTFPTTTPIYLDQLRKVSNNNVKWIWAGNNRNKQLDKIPVLEYFGYPTDTWQVWGHNIAEPLAPVNVVPANGSSVVTSTPVLKASFKMPLDGVEAYVKMEWELDTSSGFGSPDKVVTESDSDYVIANGTKTQGANVIAQETLPTADAIVGQGTWYVRARSIDEYGRYGPWSSVNSFTVSHPPSAQPVAPTGFIPQATTIRFDWNFSDPATGDYQTAEQVIVTRTDTNVVIHDSGKVASTSTYRDIAISNTYLDVPLSWKVRLWDKDDVAGPYSIDMAFTVGAPATVAIQSPTEGSTVTTANPTVTVNVVNGGTRVNSVAQLKVSQGGVTLYTSPLKEMVSPTEDDQFSMQIPTGVLLNSQTYTVRVQVWDSSGLTASDSKSFQTSWAPPAAPVFSVNAATHAASGYTRISWTNSTIDGNFSSYRVYRREVGATAWTLLDEQTSNVSAYTFDDWLAGANVAYEYAVVQVINYFGSIVESVPVPIEATGSSTDYWLIHPTDNGKNIKLAHITGDDYTEEYEQESYTVIGRGRHVDYGQRLGYAGSLQGQLRNITGGLTAREQKKELESLKAERTFLYLRNPFGDVWKVATGNLGISRLAGMGSNEYVDVDIPYEEVAF